MRLIGQEKLKDFYGIHAAAKQPCLCWIAEIREGKWRDLKQILARHRNAQLTAEKVVLFSLGKDKFKLETEVYVQNNFVIVKRIGTHKDFIS